MNLSIVIPAYNEEKRIGQTLSDYTLFFNKIYKKSYEIIVVINGCKDNTLGVVLTFLEKNKTVRYLEVKEAIGKGGAIIEGFRIAKGDLIGFVDADGATTPDSFNDLIYNIRGYDGAIASRWIKGARVVYKQPILKRMGSRGFNFFSRIFFNLKYNDTQCGAKLFTYGLVKNILSELSITKWAFDINLLYSAKRKGYKIIEVPTRWSAMTASHFNLFKAMPEMFLGLVRLRLIYSPFRFIVRLYDKLPRRLQINYYLK